MNRFFRAFILLTFACAQLSLAQTGPIRVPELTSPVIDEAGFLTIRDERMLEKILYAVKDQGQGQIQVLVLKDLSGLSVEEAAIQIFDRFKIGEAKKDNGILFLIAAHEKKMRIEVGRGFEGDLPDVIAKRILDDRVLPLMRAGRSSDAIVIGVQEILTAIKVQIQSDEMDQREQPQVRIDSFVILLIIFLIIMSLFRRLGGGGFGGPRGGGFIGGGGGSSAGGGASSGW